MICSIGFCWVKSLLRLDLRKASDRVRLAGTMEKLRMVPPQFGRNNSKPRFGIKDGLMACNYLLENLLDGLRLLRLVLRSLGGLHRARSFAAKH